MKKIYSFLAILSVPAILLTYSFSSGSPGGRSGSPLDLENCTFCHSGATNPIDSWITTNIPEEGFIAGETYQITLNAMDEEAVKFGFDLTAEDSEAKVGTFTLTDVARTQLRPATNSVTHTTAGNEPVGHEITWQFEWTAPETSSGEVTFYAAVNAANGNGQNTGDKIYQTSQSYTQFFVGIADNLLMDEVNVYPNPATSFVNVNLPENAELRIVNLSGQLVNYVQNTATTERIDLSNLANGVYFVQVLHDSERATIKLLKN